MSDYKLVVIGSGPGGVSAADAYAEHGGEGPVLLVTTEDVAPYERPPLTKETLRDERAPEPTPLESPAKTEVRLGATVTNVDLDARTVVLGDESVRFDKLVIASGALPKRLPVADDEAEVRYLRSFKDLERLHEAAFHARTALVIGSGFIGCEAAASLAAKGIAVTMVTPEPAPQINRLGEHAAHAIQEILRGYDVDLRTGVEVTGVRAPRTVHFDDGRTMEPDLVVAAVGVQPATGFLSEDQLQLHEGRVVVDRHMRSVVDGVYAVGDAARAEHAIAGRALSVEHWGDAEEMGKVAGADAADAQAEWRVVPGFWSEIGDHTLQYAAWGDGYDKLEVVERAGGFTVWYGDAEGNLVGVLTYNAEDDYERGRELIAQGAGLDAAVRGDRPAGSPDADASE